MAQELPVRLILSGLAAPTRLDKALRAAFPEWGRRAVQQTISARQVTVNGRGVWLASWLVHNGDSVAILSPPASKPAPVATWDESWLVHADGELVVVDKPAGLLAEAPPRRDATNLLELAQARFGPLVLFHRLDRDTSGVILLSRPGPINRYLAWAFQERLVEKRYLAVVAGPHRLAAHGTIVAPLGPHPQRRDLMAVVERGGKVAITDYRLISLPGGGKGAPQLVLLRPRTGRTHQLRVHLAHMGAPILGDRLYGRGESSPRLLLHALGLDLPPGQGYAFRTFQVPPPADFWPNPELMAAWEAG